MVWFLEIKRELGELIDFAMDSLQLFTITDMAMFKIFLISFGILLGITFTKFFKAMSPIVKILFVASYAYIVWKVFVEDEDGQYFSIG